MPAQGSPSPARDFRGRLSPEEHPVFFAFGRYHKFLSLAEAAQATPEERISSIWPFVVKQVSVFVNSLHQRELVNFDADDVLLEVWIELRQKDVKWKPEVGTYISFAAKIIHHLFVRLRERSRTVESPRNTLCRLREHQDVVTAGGQLSATRSKNQDDIRRTIGGVAHMGMLVPEQLGGENPEGDCLEMEHQGVFADAVRQALGDLSPLAAQVVGRLHGLWGQPVETVAQVAKEMGKSPEQVRRIRDNAHAAVREFLGSEFHPAERDLA